MNEQDARIQELAREVKKWKGRAAEAARYACYNCEEYADRKHCEKCKITKIKKEAGDQKA